MKVRFPPAPTGRKHIGFYRTMLFNWCFARREGGQVVLRFEDTDRERSSVEYEQGTMDTLRWLGLGWDEGPYRQTDRSESHVSAAQRLEESGAAYRCWCSEEELDEMRRRSMAAGRPPHWEHDRVCRSRSPGSGPAALRFEAPREGETRFVDIIRGEVVIDNASIGDRVILRSDGSPVYQLAVVVDDFEMGITHVVRGEDLMPSTALQVLLGAAVGRREPAAFAHVPLVLGPDRSRLATRHGPVALEDYRDDGLLAEGLVNYMGLLGWSFPDGREVFSLEEMKDAFDISRVGANPAIFDPVKLDSVNFEWIQRLSDEELARRSAPFFERAGVSSVDPGLLVKAMPMTRERVKRLSQVPPLIGFLFEFPGYDGASWPKVMGRDGAADCLAASIDVVHRVDPWTAEALGAAHAAAADRLGVKLRVLQAAPRVALTGAEHGPPLWDSMELLAREECLRRLEAARDRLASSSA